MILVEGVGKTSLAYQYAKKWAEGKLSTFNAVAFVCLRDLNKHDFCEVARILPHLLFTISSRKSKLCLLALLHCIFEAQVCLQSMFEQMI